ncbi:hypothetical protein HWV62_4872 [Athelia sp. TMB]|nr:hypothetical protein HWV62_4872 [Athelia sp. TMB]
MTTRTRPSRSPSPPAKHPRLAPPSPTASSSKAAPNTKARTAAEHTLSYPPRGGGGHRGAALQQPVPLVSWSYVSTPADAPGSPHPSPSREPGPDAPQQAIHASRRKRVQHFTPASLRVLASPRPPPGTDLNYGYTRWVPRAECRTRLDGLLRALLRDEVRRGLGVAPGGTGTGVGRGVVAWRGVMTKIMTAPYDTRTNDGFALNVMRRGGTLFLEEHLTGERLKEKGNMEESHRKQSYYGYAFESWSTRAVAENAESTSKPTTTGQEGDAPPGWGGDVDNHDQWVVLVKTRLGPTRLLLAGEVDCSTTPTFTSLSTLVELKTSLTIHSARDRANFEKKLLRMWAQSVLLGVPRVRVGFRTRDGRLSAVEDFKTGEIPRAVRGGGGGWDAQAALGWGARVLALLEAAVPEGDGVWRAAFVPGRGVSVRALGAEEVADVREDPAGTAEEAGVERVGFLPKWFWDAVEERDLCDSEGRVGVVAETLTGIAGTGPAGAPGAVRDAASAGASVSRAARIPPGWQI